MKGSDAIWFTAPDVDEINEMADGSLIGELQIRFTEVTDRSLVATMPVGSRSRQPFGILHGGASAALAESVASWGGNFCVDRKAHGVVGLELNINHIRSVSDGYVTAVGTPIHLGRRTQVWEVRIETEDAKLVAVSRVTLVVVDRTTAGPS